MTTVTDIGPASVALGPATPSGSDGPVAQVDPVRVLQATADCVFTQARAEADLLEAAARWADLNPVCDDSPCAADWWDGEGVPVPGRIPEVAAPAVVEFAAAAGMSSGAGKWLIFEALQLRHRMPATWTLVRQCRMRAFRARQLVMACYRLNDEAVGWLDSQVAAVVGSVGPAQVERMVMQAASLFDPEFITDQRRKRYVRIDHGDPNSGLDGAGVQAVVDPLDAVDLDAALDVGAEARKAWGSVGDHDERRAAALGDLARARLGETPLPLTEDEGPSGGPWAGAGPGTAAGVPGVPPLVGRPRELTLYVHLSDRAVISGSDDRTWLGELGSTGQLVTADLVRQWCGNPGTTVVVKPVIDLRAPIVTEVYRPSARQREHVALDDPTCAFPFCARPVHPVPVRRQPDGSLQDSWDADHIRAWRDGDDTSTDGLAGLCRQHHRGKTLHGRSDGPVPGWFEDAPVRPPGRGGAATGPG